MNTIFLVEDYHEIDRRILRARNLGATVYNAPRPIAADPLNDGCSQSDLAWSGDYRHGIFYAIILPDDDDAWNNKIRAERRAINERLDAYQIVILPLSAVQSYAKRQAFRYDRRVKWEDHPVQEWVACFLDDCAEGRYRPTLPHSLILPIDKLTKVW